MEAVVLPHCDQLPFIFTSLFFLDFILYHISAILKQFFPPSDGGENKGLAYVLLPTGRPGSFGYIDKTGKVVIQPLTFGFSEARVSDFSEGFGIMFIEDENDGSVKYVYVDHKGKILRGILFDEAENFSQGLAAVNYNGNTGFINTKGKMVIECETRIPNKFSEGMAFFEKDGKMGFIDKNGRVVIKPIFDNVIEPFDGGLACVELNNQNVYIDKQGKIVWKPGR